MNIFLGAFGSRGDVVPRVCLGRELKARGHRVTVGCVREYRRYVEMQDLEWTGVGAYPDKQEEEKVLRDVMRDPDPGRRGETLLGKLFIPMLPELTARLQDLHTQFDVFSINDLLVPAVLGSAYFASEPLIVTLTAQPIGGFALEVADLDWIKLVGSSATLLSTSANLNSTFAITDFWLPVDPEPFDAPDIEDFLNTAEKSVAIAFASAWGRDPYFSESTLIQALRMAGVRAVLQDTRSGRRRGLLDDLLPPVLVVGEVPYSWLFSRVDCVVHHGGAGTSAEALRAGRPSLALPQYGDQQYWAERLASIGASAGTLFPDQITPEKLAKLILRALEDNSIAAAVAAVSRAINPRRGIAAACDRIETLARKCS